MKLLLSACICLLTLLPSYGQELKIATVKISSVYNNYYKTKEMLAEHAAREKAIVEDESAIAIAEMTNAIRQKRNALTKTPAGQEQDRLTRELEQNQKTLAFMKTEAEKLYKTRKKASKRAFVLNQEILLSELSDFARDYAQNNHYDILFNVSGVSSTQLPVIVYTKKHTDITAALISQINARDPSQKIESNAQPNTGLSE